MVWCTRVEYKSIVLTSPPSFPCASWIQVLETESLVKFQLKKVLCMGVAVGNCDMDEKMIFQNVQLSVNFSNMY